MPDIRSRSSSSDSEEKSSLPLRAEEHKQRTIVTVSLAREVNLARIVEPVDAPLSSLNRRKKNPMVVK
ncbi:hypothetical protein KCV07_g227, partial [Aureobasidium melanogenum]